MERDSLDDILKRKLEDFSMRDAPPWSRMQRRMAWPDEEAVPVSSGRFLRRLRAGSVAAALVLLAVETGWWLWRPDVSETAAIGPGAGPSAVEWSVPPRRDTTEPDPLRDPVLNRLFASARKVEIVMPGAAPSSPENENGRDEHASFVADVLEKKEPSGKSEPERTVHSAASGESAGPAGRNAVRTRGGDPVSGFRTRKAGPHWAVSLYAVSSVFSSGGSGTSLPMRMSAMNSGPDGASVFGKTDAPAFDERMMSHRFPVSFGVSVRKRLTPKWGVETGLVYTCLHSTARTEGAFAYRYDQRVHYLGIPLSLSYSVLDSRRFECYVAGGVMAEAALSAEGTTEIFNGDVFVSSVTDRLRADGLLWSANLRAGLGVKITDDFGLYAEPGIVRRLGHADHPVSLKTEKPWSADLRIGLRFSF